MKTGDFPLKINDRIGLRARTRDEQDFWRAVFFDVSREYFKVLNLPENDLNNLLEMQFEAQTTHYAEHYPQAANLIILCAGERAGRAILSTEENDLHLIDIAVLAKFRNSGVGTTILKWLFAESRRSDLPIRFYVEKNNRAFRLYERLGFRTIADLESHYQMQWRATEN